MLIGKLRGVLFVIVIGLVAGLNTGAQTITAELSGQVTDASGGVLPKATVAVVNTATGFTRTVQTLDSGRYDFSALPVGEYKVSVEDSGFRRAEKTLTLQIGESGALDFTLAVSEAQEKVVVTATSEVTEPTRTQVSSVITERQIDNLPVNGRQFIDFALLAPAVQIGDTTSGSTDVIVEPVTKLSFAGQNIHYNFIAVDGADDISTVSGIQRGTPPQDSVREFRVINTDYSTAYGRASGGIVNIITRSGTNTWHGTLYDYLRNNAFDAKSILAAPRLNTLRQNQFGGAIGGPISKDKTFVFANYEGQRRGESPFYNSAVLNNITGINAAKVSLGLLPEPAGLSVLRTGNTDNGFLRVDQNLGTRNYLFTRYFVNDARMTNQSPLNDGFDLPSAFKDNFFRDQSLASQLTTTFGSNTNELRGQFARRTFDFPTVSTQPHLEVSNTFTSGVNRGNPDFYQEHRFELNDTFTMNRDKHTLSFGGDYNFVKSRESFPLFYPFEADFPSLVSYLGTDGNTPGGVQGCAVGALCPHPFVIFLERLNASTTPQPFTEPNINPAIYQGRRIPTPVRNQSEGVINHTYDGFFVQDKWRPTQKLAVTAGLRYEFETWPTALLKSYFGSLDPRLGVAYNLGTSQHIVIRAGAGLFHGIIPSPLLGCQIPSCGGVIGQFPGRSTQNTQNANTRLFAFASNPSFNNFALTQLLAGNYPDATTTAPPRLPPGACTPISTCGFFGDSVIVRFDQHHKNPYGAQASLGVEFSPMKDTQISISGMHIRGVHLGSFLNVNQPNPSGQFQVHTSSGATGCKNVYFSNLPAGSQGVCGPIPVFPMGAVPGVRDFADPLGLPVAVYFEATSRWDSQYDGLLINVDKRLSQHFSYGVSYTWSKSIDDGPNPSFVLIAQDTQNLRAERAVSADDVRQRFVGNLTLAAPSNGFILLRDWLFSTIVTLQSPQYFTKFAGSDVNGDIFGNNDRVGFEPRNTFKGSALTTADIRISRTFPIREKNTLQLNFEAFNVTNTVNVRFFNTAYDAADFCPVGGANAGCVGQLFRDGSPNPLYGTPRSVFNPRQLQFSLRFSF